MRIKKRVKNKIKKALLTIWPGLASPSSRPASSDSSSTYARQSFAQEGEDLLLQRLFAGKTNGFYIDVGAHHPFRFSNTYLLYQQGWRGINIDAMPGAMELFHKHRPEDLNLEIGVSLSGETLSYYMFNEPALNSFSKEEAFSKVKKGVYEIVETRKIPTRRLDAILQEEVQEEKRIDLLTIDAEGYDLEVLKSLNLSNYKPSIILIEETGGKSILNIQKESPIYAYLTTHEYTLIAKTFNTLFFQLNQ